MSCEYGALQILRLFNFTGLSYAYDVTKSLNLSHTEHGVIVDL